MAKENEADLNFIRCTNRAALYDQLERMKGQLQLCQKALENYLGRVDSMLSRCQICLVFSEIKRLAFPR
jgi:hypothetical protein